jgi:hypothetical protein
MCGVVENANHIAEISGVTTIRGCVRVINTQGTSYFSVHLLSKLLFISTFFYPFVADLLFVLLNTLA